MWSWHGYGAWGWFFGTLMMVAFWGALAWLVVQATRDRHTPERTPEDILAERYARGEIDRDEYDQRRRDLAGRLD